MTDRKNLYRCLSNAAWGYFLLHFDINLGTVSILPAFAGYLLLFSAVSGLSEERRDLLLLRPLCILLAVWNGLEWLLSWAGADAGGLFPPLDIVVTVAGLYFHFQFLTDMAALAETYQPEEGDLDQRLLRRRTVYIVLLTAAFVLLYLPAGRFEEQRGFAVTALAVILLLVALFIMAGLFELRGLFREEEGENQPSA